MSSELRKYGSTSVAQTSNIGFTSEVSDYLVVHTGPEQQHETSRQSDGRTDHPSFHRSNSYRTKTNTQGHTPTDIPKLEHFLAKMKARKIKVSKYATESLRMLENTQTKCLYAGNHPNIQSTVSDSGICLMLVGCSRNIPATCLCISGTDLLRQLYILPH